MAHRANSGATATAGATATRAHRRSTNNYPAKTIPSYYSRGMVRLPLTPAELDRGRRLGVLLRGARGDRPLLSIATTAGVSPETLRKIESGRVATPAFPTIAAVAEVLGLSLDTLWAEISPAADEGDQAMPGHDAGTRLVS